MQDVKLKKETYNRVGCDISLISLAQLNTILKIVWQDKGIKEARINNIIFTPEDSEVVIEQGYHAIQWLLGHC